MPPCGRTGHSMTFLPINQSLLIVGGRNDEVQRRTNTPFLDDVHMFLLDQKSWITVKYTPFSEKLFRLGNQSMCTMTDAENFEKTIIFGGITNSAEDKGKQVVDKKDQLSHLSNDLYVLEIRQIM